MSIADTGRMKRRPTHPGEMLREDFIPHYGLTVSATAADIGVSRQSVNELLRGRRALSPEMARRLAKLFGNSPEFWLNAQRAVDLWVPSRQSRMTSRESSSFPITVSISRCPTSVMVHLGACLSRPFAL